MRYHLETEDVIERLHHTRKKRYLDKISKLGEKYVYPHAFSSLKIEGLENIVNHYKDGKQFVFVQDHQSEYDWVITQPKLHQAEIPTAIQAGANLFVGPLEKRLKKLGGYMSVRNNLELYSSNGFLSLLQHLFNVTPFVVSQNDYHKILPIQLEKILVEEKLNNLTLPNYEVDKYNSRRKKLGRSYSGKLNPLNPGIFMVIEKVAKENKLDNLFYVPVYISYERTPEDILFKTFNDAFKNDIRKNLYDFYYTFLKFPLSKTLKQEKPRCLLRFSEPVNVLENTTRNNVKIVEDELKKMLRVYPTHLIFASIDDYYKISKNKLEDKIATNVEKIKNQNIDISPICDNQGNLLPLDNLLERVCKVFNYSRMPKIATKTDLILEFDENEVFIWHPHLARYYSNRLNHILKN